MDEILQDVRDGNVSRALIRLWLLAERTRDGAQVLSRWERERDPDRHDVKVREIATYLDGMAADLPADVAQFPIALIAALDEWRGSSTDFRVPPPELSSGDTRHWLLRRASVMRDAPAARQAPNPERWFRHYRVVPSRIVLGEATIDVAIKHLEFVPESAVDPESPFPIRVSHFNDDARMDVEVRDDRFMVRGLTDAESRSTSVKEELARSTAEGVRVWLAPELTVPPPMREEIALALAESPMERLLFCVPGSFHEKVGDSPVNRATVLNGNGLAVAVHDKMTLFTWKRPDAGDLAEGIEARRRIELLLTPIGCVGVAICKDFCDATAGGLILAAWDRLAPDWLLVPSMGTTEDTVAAHERRATEHWKLRRVQSMIANQEPDGRSGKAPGFLLTGGEHIPVTVGGTTFAAPAAPKAPDPAPRRYPRIKRVK